MAEKQKISLSIRALLDPSAAPVSAAEGAADPEPQDDALVYEVSSDGEASGIAPQDDTENEQN